MACPALLNTYILYTVWQAGAGQGGDEAEARGGGEGLPGAEEGVRQLHHPVRETGLHCSSNKYCIE